MIPQSVHMWGLAKGYHSGLESVRQARDLPVTQCLDHKIVPVWGKTKLGVRVNHWLQNWDRRQLCKQQIMCCLARWHWDWNSSVDSQLLPCLALNK